MAKYYVRIERTQTDIGYIIVEAKDGDQASLVARQLIYEGDDRGINWVDGETDALLISAKDARPHDVADFDAEDFDLEDSDAEA